LEPYHSNRNHQEEVEEFYDELDHILRSIKNYSSYGDFNLKVVKGKAEAHT